MSNRVSRPSFFCFVLNRKFEWVNWKKRNYWWKEIEKKSHTFQWSRSVLSIVPWSYFFFLINSVNKKFWFCCCLLLITPPKILWHTKKAMNQLGGGGGGGLSTKPLHITMYGSMTWLENWILEKRQKKNYWNFKFENLDRREKKARKSSQLMMMMIWMCVCEREGSSSSSFKFRKFSLSHIFFCYNL